MNICTMRRPLIFIRTYSIRTAGWMSLPINYYNNMGRIQSTMTSMSKKSHFWLRSNHNCHRMLYNNNTERDISCLEYVIGQVCF